MKRENEMNLKIMFTQRSLDEVEDEDRKKNRNPGGTGIQKGCRILKILGRFENPGVMGIQKR